MKNLKFICLIVSILLLSFSTTIEAASLVAGEAKDYIIIAPDSWRTALNYYVTKKTEQGYKPGVFSVEDIYVNYPGADSREQILNFIKDAFGAWRISYVLLAGDLSFIPSGPPVGTSREFDNYYALLDGPTDSYQDVYIGRLPAASFQEVLDISTKWANYDTYGWGRAELCLTGENAPGAVSNNDFAQYNWTVKEIYGGEVFNTLQPQDVYNEMNSGYGLINWSGHGSTSAWLVKYFNKLFYYNLSST